MEGVFVLMGALAAFGLVCALWAAAGWLLPGGRGAAAVCLCRPGLKELRTVRGLCRLRELGLLRCPVLLVDCGLTAGEREALCRLGQGIEFCGLEELPARLERERKRLG